jgi:hypothetical protein
MGGRTAQVGTVTERKHPEHTDRDAWITEVSVSRLRAYQQMLEGGGQFSRVDGSGRTDAQRSAFGELVRRELERRG